MCVRARAYIHKSEQLSECEWERVKAMTKLKSLKRQNREKEEVERENEMKRNVKSAHKS